MDFTKIKVESFCGVPANPENRGDRPPDIWYSLGDKKEKEDYITDSLEESSDQTHGLFPFVCGVCFQKFDNLYLYFKHFKCHENLGMENLEVCFDKQNICINENGKFYQCEMCQSNFITICELHFHLIYQEKVDSFVYYHGTKTAAVYHTNSDSKETIVDTSSDIGAKNIDKINYKTETPNSRHKLLQNETKSRESKEDNVKEAISGSDDTDDYFSDYTKQENEICDTKRDHSGNAKSESPSQTIQVVHSQNFSPLVNTVYNKQENVKKKFLPKRIRKDRKRNVSRKTIITQKTNAICTADFKDNLVEVKVKMEEVGNLDKHFVSPEKTNEGTGLEADENEVDVETEIVSSDRKSFNDHTKSELDLSMKDSINQGKSIKIGAINPETNEHAVDIKTENVTSDRKSSTDLAKIELDSSIKDSNYHGKNVKIGKKKTKKTVETGESVTNESNPKPKVRRGGVKAQVDEFGNKIYANTVRVACHICGGMYKKQNLNNHLVSHSETRNFQCDICLKWYKSKLHLNMHKEHHRVERNFVCRFCGKCFNTKGNLRQHERTHTAKRLHECPICQAKFTSKFILKKHSLVHSDVKPYVCEICNQDFKRHYGLIKHRVLHQTERPVPCPVCGKMFKTKRDCDKHEMIHKPPKHFCRFCGKSAITRANIKIHEKIHLRDMIKKDETPPE